MGKNGAWRLMVEPVAAGAGAPFYLEDSAYHRQLQAELVEMSSLPWSEDVLSEPIFQWLNEFKTEMAVCRRNSTAVTFADNEKALAREFVGRLEALLQQAALRVTDRSQEYPVLCHMLSWLKKHKTEVAPELEMFVKRAPVVVRVGDIFRRARAAARPRNEGDAGAFQARLEAMREAVQHRLREEMLPIERAIGEADAQLGDAIEAVRIRDEEGAPQLHAEMDEIERVQGAVGAGLHEFEEDLREHREGLEVLRHDNRDLRVRIEETRQIVEKNNRASSGGAVLEGLAGIAVAAAIKWALPAAPPVKLFPGGGAIQIASLPL
ncbi:MAG: hypothetical protein KBC64_00845 [Simkaniaceae bacterium]|nr:hypothetical protein [Simkaniaceae bacterium]